MHLSDDWLQFFEEYTFLSTMILVKNLLQQLNKVLVFVTLNWNTREQYPTQDTDRLLVALCIDVAENSNNNLRLKHDNDAWEDLDMDWVRAENVLIDERRSHNTDNWKVHFNSNRTSN